MASQIGQYKQQPSGYKAFALNPFPHERLIRWDKDLIRLLSDADRAIGRLDGIDQLVPDVDFFILLYVKKEAALSSQIEGTQATLVDLVNAEAKLPDETAPSDVDEIVNYVEAMNHGLKRLKTLPLSLRLIREIHGVLLRGVRGQQRTPGEFRASQNWIGGPTIQTAAFVPPPANDVISAMGDLEKFMHETVSNWPPLIKAGLIHAQFETIHPFLDGNGRVGRLLVTFYLCEETVLSRPLLYISEFFKRHRKDYYDKLDSYRSEEGVEDWLNFFLEGVRVVADEAVQTARAITHLREKHIKKVSGFGRNAETALQLLDKLYAAPVVDSARVAKLTGLSSKANVGSLIQKFVDAGILRETTGKMRNRRFIYQAYVEQFSSERAGTPKQKGPAWPFPAKKLGTEGKISRSEMII